MSIEKIIKTTPDKKYQIKNKEIKSEGKYTVVDQGSSNAGYTDNADKVYSPSEPVILFGDHSTRFFWMAHPFVVGCDGIKIISVVDEKYDSKFIYYYLVSSYQGDGKYRRHFADIKKLPLPKFSLAEQQNISHVLTNIDEKIATNINKNTLLQNLLKTIYQYWFLQFDFPNENGEPYHQSGGEMVFNEELQQNIPAGWEVASMNINRLCSPIKNGVKKYDGEKEYFATGDVNGLNIASGELTTYANRKSRANMEPSLYSVWFAKMKDSIKHLMINDEMKSFIESAILSTGFYGIQCTKESFEYVASFIHCSNFEYRKDKIAHGATQKAVNETDITNMLMVIPPDDVISKYHEYTSAMFSMISQMMMENKELARLRDYLLPLLMSGQVKIESENDNIDEE